MDAANQGDAGPRYGPSHVQAIARLGDRQVMVDAPLVGLIEALHNRGIITLYSCQDTAPTHGSWRDDPDKPRLYICLNDVDDLRTLLPLLERSPILARSISPSLGSPRWEYVLNPRPWASGQNSDGPRMRLQVSVFIPVEQLDLVVETLRAHDRG